MEWTISRMIYLCRMYACQTRQTKTRFLSTSVPVRRCFHPRNVTVIVIMIHNISYYINNNQCIYIIYRPLHIYSHYKYIFRNIYKDACVAYQNLQTKKMNKKKKKKSIADRVMVDLWSSLTGILIPFRSSTSSLQLLISIFLNCCTSCRKMTPLLDLRTIVIKYCANIYVYIY